MSKTIVRVGPADHGRRMSLADFEHAEVQAGYRYELSRGIITVSDVPNRLHLLLFIAIQDQLSAYKAAHPGRIQAILGGSECKMLIGAFESERHPDLTMYLAPPPKIDDADLWHHWLPEIVIEIVSPSLRKRDYREKPDEYLDLGVREYWIFDPKECAMVVMKQTRDPRSERRIKPPAIYRTRLLPGLEFSVEAAFRAAGLA